MKEESVWAGWEPPDSYFENLWRTPGTRFILSVIQRRSGRAIVRFRIGKAEQWHHTKVPCLEFPQ